MTTRNHDNTTTRGAEGTTTFFLVRHGQTESNLLGRFVGQQDSPLTELGESQARRAAERLQGERIDIAYSSPLGRAVATAEPICSALKLKFHLTNAFREMCFGPWQGCKIDDAEREWPIEFGNFRRAPDQFALTGAETFHDLERRVVGGAHALAKRHPGKRVLVVSHGVAIKVLLLHLRGQGLSAFPGMQTLENGDYVKVTVPPTREAQGD